MSKMKDIYTGLYADNCSCGCTQFSPKRKLRDSNIGNNLTPITTPKTLDTITRNMLASVTTSYSKLMPDGREKRVFMTKSGLTFISIPDKEVRMVKCIIPEPYSGPALRWSKNPNRFIGIAVCDANDEFDEVLGARIAFLKAKAKVELHKMKILKSYFQKAVKSIKRDTDFYMGQSDNAADMIIDIAEELKSYGGNLHLNKGLPYINQITIG